MASTAGTLETVCLELGKLLKPLENILDPNMFTLLGVQCPTVVATDTNVNAKLAAAKTAAGALDSDITSLSGAIGSDNVGSIVSSALPMLTHIAALISGLADVGTAIAAASATLSPSDKLLVQDLSENMALRTMEYMIVGYFRDNKPALTEIFSLLGIMDIESAQPTTLDTDQNFGLTIPRRFYLARIPTLLNNPVQYLSQVFAWNTGSFDGLALLKKIQLLLRDLNLPSVLDKPDGIHYALEAYMFMLEADASTSPSGLRFEFSLPGAGTYDGQDSFSTSWQGTVHTVSNFSAGLSATVTPPFTINLHPASGTADLTLQLGLKGQKPGTDPMILLGETGGSALQAQSISGSLEIDTSLGAAGGAVVPQINLSLDQGKLIIDFSKGDGFIQKLLSGVNMEADFSVSGSWNPTDGLRLAGQAGVEILIPLHIDLSVVIINGLYFSITFSTNPPVQIGLTTQLTANLGPLVATVDHMGVNINILFPPDGKGRLGLADIDFAFAPPKGVGLAVNTGLITGGGYLYLDSAKGEYYGALELEFTDLFSLKAVGIINTKMPDGTPGFSLLIIITADFIPIQLGFGFTLNGVGGLLGLNRTMDVDALKEGVKTGAIQSVLFPQDIIANIDKIVSDLEQIFPAYDGHFIVGPMGELGWADIITLEIGILIEIPDPKIAILGVLKALIPSEDAPLLRIQVNFLGLIDFGNQLILFNASLYDSNLLVFTLTGDMAFRLCWGDHPYFLLSVGGFNPAFKDAPPDLQNMARLGISLLNNDYIQLSVTCYFAVTSNSVQFGANAQLYAGVGALNIYGQLGFDVLFQFDPFKFAAGINVTLALRSGDSVIMGISVNGQLTGPAPWYVHGDASYTYIITISVSFSHGWGDPGPDQSQNKIDILALLNTAIADNRNWRVILPDNNSQHVSIKSIDPGTTDPVIHPFGTLTFSERIVPLGIDITRFGNDLPLNANHFDIVASDPGITTVAATDEFAAANFFDLTDDQKLSRNSFDPMTSGFSVTSASNLITSAAISEDVDYKLSYLGQESNRLRFVGYYRYAKNYFLSNLKSSAVSKSPLSYARNRVSSNAPDPVGVVATKYAIANTSDLKLYAGSLVADSYSAAQDQYNNLLRTQPGLKGQVQIVLDHELNPN